MLLGWLVWFCGDRPFGFLNCFCLLVIALLCMNLCWIGFDNSVALVAYRCVDICYLLI